MVENSMPYDKSYLSPPVDYIDDNSSSWSTITSVTSSLSDLSTITATPDTLTVPNMMRDDVSVVSDTESVFSVAEAFQQAMGRKGR